MPDVDVWIEFCRVFSSGLLVPGGFGSRGVEGKITAVNWARVHQRPFLGVCLGLQVAVIEFARNVLNMQGDVLFSNVLFVNLLKQ